MAKSAEEYCEAIDSFLADGMTAERCFSIMGERTFKFEDTKPQGSPSTRACTDLKSHGWSGRGLTYF